MGPGWGSVEVVKKPFASLLVVVSLAAILPAQRQNPFQPPAAKLHYAPDRVADLQHVRIDIDVDYPNRTIVGKTTNTFIALRTGADSVTLHAGESLEITGVKVNGSPADFARVERELRIKTGKLTRGKPVSIDVGYKSQNSRGQSFGAGGGWHWIQPRQGVEDPVRVGFWTQGETAYNSEWAPTWDYPNDFATSETRTTVDATWDVVGNGVLKSATPNAGGKRKTFVWEMTQPHATYLISLVGGPFDIQKDRWQDIDLWYVVPKGQGKYISSSFGDTKDMLTFFSSRLGVKYPWPKYAQNAMFDFGGGMENVSSTTLGEGALTEERDGFLNMSGLNAHELAHQWFGDLVSCKHWGDIWLNESFATFMQALYFEHARGKDDYDHEVEGMMRGYFAESRRYKRPLSTKLYANPEVVFDSHAYPKGGSVLHTLRRLLGDEPFFAGLNLYLTQHRHTPVESFQLRRALTESSGINLERFWEQWIDKPGHPVLDYTWSYEGGKLKVAVKQTQDTSDGTPLYDLPMKLMVVRDGLSRSPFELFPIPITQAEESFEFDLPSRPLFVLLDPFHDFLREIPNHHWTPEQAMLALRLAPNATDREAAMNHLVRSPTHDGLSVVTESLREDFGLHPALRNVGPLVNLNREDLRGFWTEQLKHPNFDRRAEAVRALGRLPATAATTLELRSFVTSEAPIRVVTNALSALAAWDKEGNKEVFQRALNIEDRRGLIRRAAERALRE